MQSKSISDFDSDLVWSNATITRVDITTERGIAVPFVSLSGNGWGVDFGGVVWGPGADPWLRGVMACAGVEKWSAMVGRNVRVLGQTCGSSVRVIAHITDDSIVFDQDAWAAHTRRMSVAS